jgi:hypothetical protein
MKYSNCCAGSQRGRCAVLPTALIVALLTVTGFPGVVFAQEDQPAPVTEETSQGKRVALFLAGGATGLALHESAHLIADAAFGEKPGLKKVDFHGIPFFAITHRSGLPRRQEFTISSAGFWMQHAENEWLLSQSRPLRDRGPFPKGLFTFNVVASAAYAGAAFAKTGPVERDTRGIAESARVDERWVGALLLAPAVLDAWRYFHPDAKWAAWSSRGVKIGMALLIVR